MGLALTRSGKGWSAVALAASLLAGCAQTGVGTAVPSTEGVVAPISDPVVLFAAESSPGAEQSVVLPSTGQTAQVRLVRSYAAASGRECREVMVRTQGASETRLFCRAGTGWREARPLIRDASLRP